MDGTHLMSKPFHRLFQYIVINIYHLFKSISNPYHNRRVRYYPSILQKWKLSQRKNKWLAHKWQTSILNSGLLDIESPSLTASQGCFSNLSPSQAWCTIIKLPQELGVWSSPRQILFKQETGEVCWSSELRVDSRHDSFSGMGRWASLIFLGIGGILWSP